MNKIPLFIMLAFSCLTIPQAKAQFTKELTPDNVGFGLEAQNLTRSGFRYIPANTEAREKLFYSLRQHDFFFNSAEYPEDLDQFPSSDGRQWTSDEFFYDQRTGLFIHAEPTVYKGLFIGDRAAYNRYMYFNNIEDKAIDITNKDWGLSPNIDCKSGHGQVKHGLRNNIDLGGHYDSDSCSKKALSALPPPIPLGYHAAMDLGSYDNVPVFYNTDGEFQHTLQDMAENGDRQAMDILAITYYTGALVSKNHQKAIALWQKAADAGYGDAQLALGLRYLQGDGVEQDPYKAITWLEYASDKHMYYASEILGDLYYNGIYVKQDYGKAILYLKRALKNDHALMALTNLSDAYFKGNGVVQNWKKGFDLLRKSAENGNPEDQYRVALCYLDGKYTHAHRGKAFFYMEKAAYARIPEAQIQLGLMYAKDQEAIGAPADNARAVFWLTEGLKKSRDPSLIDQAKVILDQIAKSDHGKKLTWSPPIMWLSAQTDDKPWTSDMPLLSPFYPAIVELTAREMKPSKLHRRRRLNPCVRRKPHYSGAFWERYRKYRKEHPALFQNHSQRHIKRVNKETCRPDEEVFSHNPSDEKKKLRQTYTDLPFSAPHKGNHNVDVPEDPLDNISVP